MCVYKGCAPPPSSTYIDRVVCAAAALHLVYTRIYIPPVAIDITCIIILNISYIYIYKCVLYAQGTCTSFVALAITFRIRNRIGWSDRVVVG